MPHDDDRPLTDLELHLGADGRVETWSLVHRVFCPIHDRELDTHGCLACKASGNL